MQFLSFLWFLVFYGTLSFVFGAAFGWWASAAMWLFFFGIVAVQIIRYHLEENQQER
ncbi:hypothetical protein [Neisseria animalis]|uniref:hypothetical protein n=1 Tax=Neisseria animalis TaxID=492 RepID=UPI000F6D3841|nr:hypothetical protein [Neisseria animalis]VEE07066.1 Uncharacterised protein [Neisseria animalis]